MAEDKLGTLLSIADIERAYNVKRWVVYDLIRSGLLPSLRIGTRRLYVKMKDWERYLETAEAG